MTKCIILEEPSLDVSQAKSYGDLTILFPRSQRRPSIWAQDFQESVYERLEAVEFDPTTDYFVVVGHLVPIVEVTAYLVTRYGRINFLFYSSTESVYVPRVIGEHRENIDAAAV